MLAAVALVMVVVGTVLQVLVLASVVVVVVLVLMVSRAPAARNLDCGHTTGSPNIYSRTKKLNPEERANKKTQPLNTPVHLRSGIACSCVIIALREGSLSFLIFRFFVQRRRRRLPVDCTRSTSRLCATPSRGMVSVEITDVLVLGIFR